MALSVSLRQAPVRKKWKIVMQPHTSLNSRKDKFPSFAKIDISHLMDVWMQPNAYRLKEEDLSFHFISTSELPVFSTQILQKFYKKNATWNGPIYQF